MAVASRNSEVVREAFARWAASDVSGVVSLYTPDVILETSGLVLSAGIRRGRRQVTAALQEVVSREPVRPLRELRLEESGDWVLALADFGDEQPFVGLFRVTGGLISFVEAHQTEAAGRERLRALGTGAAPEPAWAAMGSTPFAVGHVEVDASRVVLYVEDDKIVVPLPAELDGRVSSGDPVLIYAKDQGELLGWYLPELQLGVDLRARAAQ